MKKANKFRSRLVSLGLAATLAFPSAITVKAAERVNFALDKAATASYTGNWGPEKAVDGDFGSRWDTEPKGSNQWLCVDLGKTTTFDEFLIASENNNNQKIKKFKIEGSLDGISYDMIYDSPEKNEGFDLANTVKLGQAVSYRYVRLTIESLISGAYPSISIREFQVFGNEEEHISDVKNALSTLAVPSKIYRDFDVPVQHEESGVTFVWEAMNDAVCVDENGHVTLKPSEDRQDSGLRVTASKNGYSQTMEFSFQVYKNELRDYKVYPVPQKLTYGAEGAILALDTKVKVNLPEDTDENVRNYVEKVFHNHQFETEFAAETKENTADILLGVAGDGSAADAYFAEKEYDQTASTEVVEGYVLSVDSEKNTVAILGHDSFGLYNGVSTLAQMLDSSRSQLKDVMIEDSPNTLFRGIIEGFYGQYTHKERLDLIRFIGPLKMNTYIYGAKNDPYHNGQWRDPYPEQQLKEIGELVQCGKESNVELVWSAHVGGHINMGDPAEYKALTDKFDQLYSIGVRQFALFYDDAYTDPTYLVDFINKLNREYINKKPGVKDLIFCPEQYCKTRVSGNYLDRISNFDQDVQIMWTGDSVISEVSPSMMEWIEARIKRPAYIWWNYPVNDLGLGNQMLVGETAGLSTEMEAINGLVSNPMLQAQASKFSLFSIADYGWNIKEFDSYKSWDAAVDYIIEEKEYADAFKTFSANNNQSVAELKEMSVESAELAKVFDEFREAYYAGKDISKIADQVIEELDKIEKACDLLKTYHNQELVNQVKPWMNQLVPIVKSGKTVVENLKNICAADLSDEAVFKTAAGQYKEAEKTLKNIGGKWSGRKEIIPFLQEMQASIHQTLLGELGQDTLRPLTNYRDGAYLKSKLPELADGNAAGFQLDEKETDGKWFGVDLGCSKEVKHFEILIGSGETDTNKASAYKVQISNDSVNWTDVETVEEKNCITNTEAVTARFIRYYAEDGCGKNVQVREFFVDRTDKTIIADIEREDNLFVKETLSEIYVGSSEDVIVKPNEYLGVQFENAKKFPVLEENTDLTLEYSIDNVHWTEYTEGEVIARFVRVKNNTDENITAAASDKLITLRLTDALVPTNLSVEELGLATWSGNKDQIIDGNRNTYHWTKDQAVDHGYVIDLKKAIKLYDVTVVMGDGDFMESGVIEISSDKNAWEEVGKIQGAKVTTVNPQKEARYIRIRMVKNSGTWLKLAEVEVNQLASGTDAPLLSDMNAQNVIDADLTTGFTCPNEAGSFEFYNYQKPQSEQLKLYKNNGAVVVEAFIDGEWTELNGTGTEVTTYSFEGYAEKFRVSWAANSGVVLYEMQTKGIVSYADADYSKVDEAIAKAAVLVKDQYSESSWSVLQAAVNAVERGYDSSKQAEVDQMAAAIEKALEGLELRTEAKTTYTVKVDGQIYRENCVYNEEVVLDGVEIPEGKTFTGWSVDGKLVSVNPNYKFYISGDIEFTAEFEEKEMEAQAFVSNVIVTEKGIKSDVKFVGQIVVPDGYELLEAGLVWSSKADKELVLGQGLKPTYVKAISNTNQFSVTIKGMPNGNILRGRIFATLKNTETGETQVVYSVERKAITKK